MFTSLYLVVTEWLSVRVVTALQQFWPSLCIQQMYLQVTIVF